MMISAERFRLFCDEYRTELPTEGNIGTYKEKRLHQILKRVICENEECLEVKIGRYCADILDGDTITEIQTGSFYPLREKISYYLNETDYFVRIIHPVISEKRIVRIDRESGEVIRCRRSPKKVSIGETNREIFWLAEQARNPRLEIVILYISAEEHRYSDEVKRYRKEGKYDSELFPRELIRSECFCGADSYLYLLEGCPETFSAKEYGKIRGLSGRNLYRTLNMLCLLGLLEKRKSSSKEYMYLVRRN